MMDRESRGNDGRIAHWLTEAYGAPSASSEVTRIDGFYSAAALTAFGTETVPSAAALSAPPPARKAKGAAAKAAVAV